MHYVIRLANGQKVYDGYDKKTFETLLDVIAENTPFDIDMFGSIETEIAIIDNIGFED